MKPGQEGLATAARPHERGSILALALMLSVVLVVLTVPFIGRYSNQNRTTERDFDGLSALVLAEAGVERAIWELNYGNLANWSGNAWQRTLTLSNVSAADGTVVGNVSITIDQPISMLPTITSVGTVNFQGVGDLSRTVRCVLAYSEPPVFNLAVFGSNGVDLQEHVQIKSYDSRPNEDGEDVSKHGTDGDVGTNSQNYHQLRLWHAAKVYGDAFAGYEGDPSWVIDQDSHADITGAKTAMSSVKDLPPILAPAGYPDRGDVVVPDGANLTISESGSYGNLTLGYDSEVTITADSTLVISGTLTLSQKAELKLAEGAKARIYFGGDWAFSNEAKITNVAHDPSALLMFGTSTFNPSAALYNINKTYAAMYFPTADITLTNHMRFFGGIVARSVNIGDHVEFYYDVALRAVQTGHGAGGGFGVKAWQEKTQ